MFQESQPPGRLIIKAGKLGFRGLSFIDTEALMCLSEASRSFEAADSAGLPSSLANSWSYIKTSRDFLSPPCPCSQSSFLVDRICHSFNSYLTAIQPPSFFSFHLSSHPPLFFFFFLILGDKVELFYPLFLEISWMGGMWFTLHSILQKPN